MIEFTLSRDNAKTLYDNILFVLNPNLITQFVIISFYNVLLIVFCLEL